MGEDEGFDTHVPGVRDCARLSICEKERLVLRNWNMSFRPSTAKGSAAPEGFVCGIQEFEDWVFWTDSLGLKEEKGQSAGS